MVPFFSGSQPLAFKSSSKSHQMTTYFIRNDKVFTKMKSLFSQYSFWMRKIVIWWLFSDDLRARGLEPEKKDTQIPRLIQYFEWLKEQGFSCWQLIQKNPHTEPHMKVQRKRNIKHNCCMIVCWNTGRNLKVLDLTLKASMNY